MGSMRQVLGFDAARGLIDVEAGIEWPELMRHLVNVQQGAAQQWGIRQKQTGADRLSIGGALAANAHGRGLKLKPFIGDVESFVLVEADGVPRTCSRAENAELFRLAIGGDGGVGGGMLGPPRPPPRGKGGGPVRRAHRPNPTPD